MQECRCEICDFKLGEAEVGSVVNLYCKKCKIINKFTIIKEPDCRRVTVFIELQNNEKTAHLRNVITG